MSGSPSGRLLGTAAAFAVLLALASRAAAGADAPPSDAARRADIARGAAAAERCARQVWHTEDYSSCIDTVAGGATDDAAKAPFQLGVYCKAFYTAALAYRDWSRKPASGAAAHADGDLLRETTLDQYDSCLFQAQQVKLETRQICAAAGLSCAELNPIIDRWQAVTRVDE